MRHGNPKVDMSTLSGAAVKRRQRDSMRARGFKLLQVWVHPRDRRRVLALVAKCKARRAP